MEDFELPVEPASATAQVLAEAIADAGLELTNRPFTPGELPRFAVDISPAGDLDTVGVALVALVAVAKIPGVVAPDLFVSALHVLSSGTHARAVAFALRDHLAEVAA